MPAINRPLEIPKFIVPAFYLGTLMVYKPLNENFQMTVITNDGSDPNNPVTLNNNPLVLDKLSKCIEDNYWPVAGLPRTDDNYSEWYSFNSNSDLLFDVSPSYSQDFNMATNEIYPYDGTTYGIQETPRIFIIPKGYSVDIHNFYVYDRNQQQWVNPGWSFHEVVPNDTKGYRDKFITVIKQNVSENKFAVRIYRDNA